MKKLPVFLLCAGLASDLLANAGPGPWANGAYYPGQLDGRYSANVYNDTQSRFHTGEENSPSGNRRFNDATTVTPATTSSSFQTNVTVNVVDENGIITTTNTTNITTVFVTNAAVTNVDSYGAADVVSGVLGFAIRNGTPSTSSSGGTSAGSTNGTTTIGAANSGADAGSSTGTLESIGLDTSQNYFVVYVNGDIFAGQTAANVNIDTKRVAGSLLNGAGGVTYQVVTNLFSNSIVTEVLAVPGATAGGYFNAKIKNMKSPFVFKGAGAISVRSESMDFPSGTYPFNVDGIKSSDNTISGYSQVGRNAP